MIRQKLLLLFSSSKCDKNLRYLFSQDVLSIYTLVMYHIENVQFFSAAYKGEQQSCNLFRFHISFHCSLNNFSNAYLLKILFTQIYKLLTLQTRFINCNIYQKTLQTNNYFPTSSNFVPIHFKLHKKYI